jgi:hypothetical protein
MVVKSVAMCVVAVQQLAALGNSSRSSTRIFAKILCDVGKERSVECILPAKLRYTSFYTSFRTKIIAKQGS